MQELVLNKLDELGLKRKDELKYAEKIIASKSGDMPLRSLLRQLRMALKRQLDLLLLEPGMLLKSPVWQLQRSIERL